MVPTFTVVRSTGEAPGFAPAVSSRPRRRPSPRPARPDTLAVPAVPRPGPPPGWRRPARLRTALPPISTGFERVDDQEALRHRFLACTFPSRSPGTARPVVPDRPDFVAAAPTCPGVPRGQAAASFTALLRQRGHAGLSPPSGASEVDPERGADLTVGPFLRVASRTRRAPLSAPGSPQAPKGWCVASGRARPRGRDAGSPVVVALRADSRRIEQHRLPVGRPDAVAPTQLFPGCALVLAVLPPDDFLP